MSNGFDKWFRTYLLNETSACWDRDILRWAKPILEVGYNELVEKEELEFLGAEKYLKLDRAEELLKAVYEDAKTPHAMSSDLFYAIEEFIGENDE